MRSSAGGAVPASRRYQVVQYGGRHGTCATGTETVLTCIELVAVGVYMVDSGS